MKPIVDPEEQSILDNHGWCFDSSHGYFVATINYKKVYLHRMIMQVTESKIYVDHINGNKVDNRKSNLRLCSQRDNLNNRGAPVNNTSGYKGVYWHAQNKRWAAQIVVHGKKISLKTWPLKEEAAKAYNEAAIKYFGEFAYLNKVD